MALIALADVTLTFRGPPVLDRANLTVEPGERVCLLGRNGTGKTTLLGVLQGTLEPDRGEVIRQQGLRTAMLPQEVPRDLQGSVWDEVVGGFGPRRNCWPSIIAWPAGWPESGATPCRRSWAASNTPWRPTAAGTCTSRSRPSCRG